LALTNKFKIGKVILATMFAMGGCGIDIDDTTQLSQPPVSNQVVLDWNIQAVTTPQPNSARASRLVAIVAGAMHDAANGNSERYEPYAVNIESQQADPRATVASAAYTVLVGLVPSRKSVYDAALANSLASIPDSNAKTKGIQIGQQIGQATLALRANDGSDPTTTFNPPTGIGYWVPTPPAFLPHFEPQWGGVRPFTLDSGSQFRPPPPNPVGSDAYVAEYNEVKSVGQDTSTTRTADETHMAHFWYEGSVIGWNRIARDVAVQKGADLYDTARNLALMDLAMADGFIAGMEAKTTYARWRPITAIRADDGDPRTDSDPTWNALRPTPNIASYPSTHSVLGNAAADILAREYGDDVTVTEVSNTAVPAGSSRTWNRFSDAANENAYSRLLVGVHFRSDNEQGQAQGTHIADWAAERFLRRLK